MKATMMRKATMIVRQDFILSEMLKIEGGVVELFSNYEAVIRAA